jgi:3-methyladenine DNA glycosylase/8-oxoguanine DNA glycosylase
VTTSFEIPLRGPGGELVDLRRTLNSHGFSDLAPLRPDAATNSLEATVRVRRAKPRRIRLGAGSAGRVRVEIIGPAVGASVRTDVEAGARRILRLDQDLSGFYRQAATDPDLAWAATGAGRMLRSPSVFEDVVKTICTTNCTWSATVRMTNALVANLGEPPAGVRNDPLANAFPSPAAMAAAPPSFYIDTVRAGYRGAYLLQLARSVADGQLDLEALGDGDVPDDDLETELLALPGVGPYAAAHIMMTLGRNSRLILDSWTRPTYSRLVGRKKPVPDATIRRRFRPYGDHAGLAFWLFVTRDW